jgi:phosphatidate phosphatase APP1
MRIPLWTSVGFTLLVHAITAQEVTFYPTYGYHEPARQGWVIPLRARVVTAHKKTQLLFRELGHDYAKVRHYSKEARGIFDERLEQIVVNIEKTPTLTVAFEQLPANTYSINRDEIFLPDKDVEAAKLILAGDLMLTFHATNAHGGGKVQLLSDSGHSIVSDIDDTIKTTEVPGGFDVVLTNTLFLPFSAAPTMIDRYKSFYDEKYSFHYVSAGPWEMYQCIQGFITGNNFPDGSIQMRDVPINFKKFPDLIKELVNKDAAYDYKVREVEALISHFKDKPRKFTLIGDSGERDIDVYRTIRGKFPDNVEKVIIREVVCDRLGVDEIILAVPVKHGESQFPKP